jgi:hypothetical protein
MSGSSGYGSGSSGPTGPVVETLTGNVGGSVAPTLNNINIIGSGTVLVTGNPGTSTLTITNSGSVTDQYDADTGTAVPSGGIINILGGASTAGVNIHTTASGNTVDVILNDSILLPATNGSGTEGVIYLDGSTFMHAGGDDSNTFLGTGSGNLTNTGTINLGLGIGALSSLTSGFGNVAAGNDALSNATNAEGNVAIGNALANLVTGLGNIALGEDAGDSLSGANLNILIGHDVADSLLTGSNNIIIGESSGSAYTGAESSNIIISNTGDVSEDNVIRLGTDGSGTGQQNATYLAGVYNRSFASPSGVMQIDHNFKVGSSAGTNGQLLIGSTGASPLWANLTSTGGSVVITNNANAINLEATGTGAGASSFPTDAGTATEAAGVLNIFGGANINTTATGNTVVVNLNEFISLPNTNTAADEGVLYLGSNTFLHNYGTANTFLGQAAGNQTLTTADATGNVGIGTQVLQSLTIGELNTSTGDQSLKFGTSADQNCAYGNLSLNALTTGSLNSGYGLATLSFLLTGASNLALGAGSGNNYTSSESSNILVGNPGVNGESNVIRIGVQGTSPGEQNTAYMAGIYGSSIGSTNSPVFIDNTGKLGTSSGGVATAEAFMAFQNGNQALGAGSVNYSLGSLTPLTIIYDDGSNVYVGSGVGSPATFTAPTTGRYVLMTTISSSGGQTTFLSNTITTTARTYVDTSFNGNTIAGGPTFICLQTNILADMTAGDTATFSVQTSHLSGTTVTGGTATAPITFMSGYRLQ